MTAGLLGWLALAATARADHVPPQVPSGRVLELQTDLRYFHKKGRVQYQAEAASRWEDSALEWRYRALTLGPVWRARRDLKLGAFYRVQWGARHDDDWAQLPNRPAGHWAWRDTRGRAENVLILDATPRALLPWGRSESWVASLKSQYLLNTYNGQHTFKLKPELTYFWMRGLNPFMSFSTAYEVFLPLNYGAGPVNERWLYLAALRHLGSGLTAGGSVALRDWTWGTSQAWKDGWPGDEYRVSASSVVLGLIVVWQFQAPGAS